MASRGSYSNSPTSRSHRGSHQGLPSRMLCLGGEAHCGGWGSSLSLWTMSAGSNPGDWPYRNGLMGPLGRVSDRKEKPSLRPCQCEGGWFSPARCLFGDLHSRQEYEAGELISYQSQTGGDLPSSGLLPLPDAHPFSESTARSRKPREE